MITPALVWSEPSFGEQTLVTGFGKWSWDCYEMRGFFFSCTDLSHHFIPSPLPWDHLQWHQHSRSGSLLSCRAQGSFSLPQYMSGWALDEETHGKWAAGRPSRIQPQLGWLSWGASVPGDMLSFAQVSAGDGCQSFLVLLAQTMVPL